MVIGMKLLMFDTESFWYKTYDKTVAQADVDEKEEAVADALVVFINVEKEDEAAGDKKAKKAADNIEWLSKKTGRRRIVLHSFAHLSDSRSSIEFAKHAIGSIKERLNSRGYEASSTPFGHLLEFDIRVRGESLAKVWKSI